MAHEKPIITFHKNSWLMKNTFHGLQKSLLSYSWAIKKNWDSFMKIYGSWKTIITFHGSWKSLLSYSWAMKKKLGQFHENSWVMKNNNHFSWVVKVSLIIFMGHEKKNLRQFLGKFMIVIQGHENLFCSFHGPWNAFNGIFTGNSWHFHKRVGS